MRGVLDCICGIHRKSLFVVLNNPICAAAEDSKEGLVEMLFSWLNRMDGTGVMIIPLVCAMILAGGIALLLSSGKSNP